jgi:hypothetical protein
MRVFDGTLICCCFQRSGHRVILRVDLVVGSRVEVIVRGGGSALALPGAGGRCCTPVAAYRPAATAVASVGHYSYRSAAVGEEDGRTDRGNQCGGNRGVYYPRAPPLDPH